MLLQYGQELFLRRCRDCVGKPNKQRSGFLLFLLWYYWGSCHLSVTNGKTSCSHSPYCYRQVLSNMTSLMALKTCFSLSASYCEQFLPTGTQIHSWESEKFWCFAFLKLCFCCQATAAQIWSMHICTVLIMIVCLFFEFNMPFSLMEKCIFLHNKPYDKDVYDHKQCSTALLQQTSLLAENNRGA